ncbi:proton-coupled amino acid transporter 2-like isoform X2 [Sycon ciliatum]|uniref:proton-coupled amino acid transporter 2-like isoform X2 n=1 Tax=Sycon ciliatum TaxID=27933 RepID=UPI0031F67249
MEDKCLLSSGGGGSPASLSRTNSESIRTLSEKQDIVKNLCINDSQATRNVSEPVDSDVSDRSTSPYLHSSTEVARNRRLCGISDAETLLHIVKGNIGTGIIGLPYAFMFAGFAVGFASMVLVCVVAVYCMLMLVQASHRLCDLHNKQQLDYATTAELSIAVRFTRAGLPKLFRRTVNAFLIITQLGFTAIYFVFISKNMAQVLEAMRYDLDYHYLILIFIPVLIVGVWIRDLKQIAIFSGIGNVLQSISIVIILYYLCGHLHWSDTRLYPKKVSDMALFFGLAVFSVEGIGVVMPLENDMKKPRHFPAIVIGGMSFVSTLFLLVGSFGFICFREDTLGSITLNLPGDSHDPNNLPYIYVKLFFTFAIMSSYLVQFYVAIQIIEPFIFKRLGDSERKRALVSHALRAGLVIGAAGLAAGVPNLGLFISLVGALGSSALAIIFPPIIHMAVFWNDHPGVLWKIRNILIAFIGILGMVTGTYATVVELIETLADEHK